MSLQGEYLSDLPVAAFLYPHNVLTFFTPHPFAHLRLPFEQSDLMSAAGNRRSHHSVLQVSSGWAVRQELTFGLCVSTWVWCSGSEVRCRNWGEFGLVSWERRSASLPVCLWPETRFKVLSSVLLVSAGLLIKLWNRNLQQRHRLHHL